MNQWSGILSMHSNTAAPGWRTSRRSIGTNASVYAPAGEYVAAILAEYIQIEKDERLRRDR